MSVEPIASQALRTNLERTRRALDDVELPPEHQWLLSVSQDKPGANKRATSCLWELSHPLPDVAQAGAELRTIVLGDFWFYLECSDPPRAMAALASALGALFALRPPLGVRERACHTVLEFATLLLHAPRAGRFDEAIDICVRELDGAVRAEEVGLARASGYLKTMAAPLVAHPRAETPVRTLLRDALRASIELWRASLRIEEWYESRRTLFDDDHASRIAALGSGHWFALERALEKAEPWSALCAIDDFHKVADQVRALFDTAPSARDRARYLLYAMHLPGMDDLQGMLLWDLQATFRSLDGRDDETIDGIVRTICDELRSWRSRHHGAVLGCLLSLGQVVYATERRPLVERFLQQVVSSGFVGPRPVGAEEHPEVGSAANHAEDVRIWLQLIALNPAWSTTLISALTITLAMDGALIADTDLFQRDVSRLLNSPVAPCYRQVTQLCRRFPVFFEEVGAEGELRDYSTRIDELTHRGDKVVHFFRTQIHAESNSSHVALSRALLGYWAEREPARMAPLVPNDLRSELARSGPWIDGVHAVVKALADELGCEPGTLPDRPVEAVDSALAALEAGTAHDRERVGCLIHVHALLLQKYSLEADGTLPQMRRLARTNGLVTPAEVTEYERLLARDDLDEMLAFVYRLMARMRAVILDPQPTEAREDIYLKRHIAPGIPSMYGTYFEPKCAALGLSYRLESVASRLLEQLVGRIDDDLLSRRTLRRVAHLLERFREGLELSGIDNEGLRSHLSMLEASLRLHDFSLAQFVNLFQFVAQNVREIMHEHFLGHHERILPMVMRQRLTEESEGALAERSLEQAIHARSEVFYRDLLAQAFLVGQLDSFVAHMLDRLTDVAARVPAVMVQRLIDFELDLAFTLIDAPHPEVDNPVFLGGKGHFLKKLRGFGYPVPPGFILTTEVFRIRDVFATYPELRDQIAILVDDGVNALEQATGRRLGDPDNPLLLSVRSAAAMSMPGAMSTFLNVGLNDDVVGCLGNRPDFAWTAWDSYRRLLQMWGMAHGVRRDDFDRIITDFKQRCAVREKVQFRPDQMSDIAHAYQGLLARAGLELDPDPRSQLLTAIRLVLDSWDAPVARAYRDQLSIADQWGTAAIVQQMVFGNLGPDSGTGVTFTSNPFANELGVSLYGDFTTASQGEDVVAGLVHPWPVSRHQLERAAVAEEYCLEVQFPEIYAELERLARDLVLQRGFDHQEVEFTFESGRRQDLYLLQTRDHSWMKTVSAPIFDATGLTPLASGVGIGGGAMNGFVAFDADDLGRLAVEHPGAPRVLVRRDTVPDDIGMIFACDGLLTARGGVTSHAGVTASRLGKTGVVNCRSLEVDELSKACRVQGTEFRSGDAIAIDGFLGTIYAGHLPIVAADIVDD